MSARETGRKRGRLSAEDREIWERVVRSAKPLEPGRERDRGSVSQSAMDAGSPPRAARGPATGPDDKHAPQPWTSRVLRPDGRGESQPRATWMPAQDRPGRVGRPEPGLDRRTAERLRRGERAPDARVDLHGLSAERAHRRLDRFMASSLAAGHRCVLVITGKGGRRNGGEDAPFMTPDIGILRDAAPRWLRSGPHADRIVGIFEAHARHGGGGAFYVYLKRGR